MKGIGNLFFWLYIKQGDTYYRTERRAIICWDWRRKIWDIFFETIPIFGKNYIFFIASKLVSGFLLQMLTLCAKSYLEVMYWRKKYGTRLIKNTFKFLFIKSCIYNTYSIDLTSKLTQRPNLVFLKTSISLFYESGTLLFLQYITSR